MPKTSIARSKYDSKQKREFTDRSRRRQDKKNRKLNNQENMFVDKLQKLKDRKQKIKEDKKVQESSSESEDSDNESMEEEQTEQPEEVADEEMSQHSEEKIEQTNDLTSKLLDEDNKVAKIIGSSKRQADLIATLKSGELHPQKYLTFVEVSRQMSNEDGYMDSEVRKYFTQHLADLALKMSNIGLK